MSSRHARLKALGFTEWHTGGGCMALRLTHPKTKRYILITDDAGIPADTDPCTVGEYTPDGMNTDPGVFGGEECEIFPPEATDMLIERIEHWLHGERDPNDLEPLLCDLLRTFARDNGLELASADDMRADLMRKSGDESWGLSRGEILDAQIKWLTAYIELWDASGEFM